jgi:poly(3-hydroxybutyrate) depolymerase
LPAGDPHTSPMRRHARRSLTVGTTLVSLAVGACAPLCACSGESASDPGGLTPSSSPAADSGSPPRSDASAPGSDAAPAAPPPTPSGCITDVTPGDHTFTCEGLSTDVSIPDACMQPGCGLITQIHGDTGTGALMDANTNLKALGKQRGFVVVSPTGPPWPGAEPGSTWRVQDDEKVVAIIAKVAEVFRTDPKRNHVTGFSRGGFVTWRLLCKHADMFASFAPATAGSSNGGTCNGVNEVSCPFDANVKDGMPSVEVPTLFLVGRTDTPVPLGCTSRIRDQAIAAWGLAEQPNVDGNAQYTHRRWTNAKGTVLETFEHSYETVPGGPWASAKGHCFPGSTMDPMAPQYAVPCKLPNAFTWGEQVIAFFEAHPKK